VPHPNCHKEEDIMLKNIMLGSIALVAGLFLASSVMAVIAPAAGITREGTMTINATAIAACNLSAVPSLNFGNYDSNATINIGDTIQVICNSASPYTVDLNRGTSVEAACTNLGFNRCLTDGAGNQLGYALTEAGAVNFFRQLTGTDWRNIACTGDEWLGLTGDVAGDGQCHIEAIGTGASVNHLLDATMVGGQAISGLGGYTDTVTVTLNF